MTFFGYLNTGLFPVVYKIGDLNFFATKAAAESDSDCSKCELFYLHKDKKLFVSNKPKKLLFNSAVAALGFCEYDPLAFALMPPHIEVIGIFYEKSLETEVYSSAQYTQDSDGLINNTHK